MGKRRATSGSAGSALPPSRGGAAPYSTEKEEEKEVLQFVRKASISMCTRQPSSCGLPVVGTLVKIAYADRLHSSISRRYHNVPLPGLSLRDSKRLDGFACNSTGLMRAHLLQLKGTID